MSEFKPYQLDQPYSDVDAFTKAVGEAIASACDSPQEVTGGTEVGAAASPFNHSDEEWFAKLTVPPEELSAFERDAIAVHVAGCPDCSAFLTNVVDINRLMDELPDPDFPPGLPPKLLQLWQEEDHNGSLPPDIP